MASASDRMRLECGLDLQRRLPPNMIEKTVSNMIDLAPDLCEDLLEKIDQPLKMMKDELSGRDFLLCDYNRDGDCYRSPWSNLYHPNSPGVSLTFYPSEVLRKIEIEMNDAFDYYRDAYYDGGISSVYLWDTTVPGFAGVILIKKAGDGSQKIRGCWDSIHVFEVKEMGDSVSYTLTSTVMLWLQTMRKDSGLLNLGGSLTRQFNKVLGSSSEHIIEIGKMVEEVENKLRISLNSIYFDKTRDIVNHLRTVTPLSERAKNREQLAAELGHRVSSKQF